MAAKKTHKTKSEHYCHLKSHNSLLVIIVIVHLNNIPHVPTKMEMHTMFLQSLC